MHYLHILVASNNYHGNEPLTYASKQSLEPGVVVLVPLRNKRVSGIVVAEVAKPAFAAKEILSVQIPTPLPTSSLELLAWLAEYYPAPSGSIVSQFVPNNLMIHGQDKDIPALNSSPPSERLPHLTADQARALKVLESDQQTVLLHGDTGTGKTRLYIELALRVIEKGQSALILTPEIGLTSQLALEFERSVSVPIIVVHSNLTGKQRRRLWLQVLYTTKPVVVIGPRSALFTPFHNLGLIVVDEAHDSAYKQDQAPHYNALRVAGSIAHLHKAKLVFGSATPLITEYSIMKAKKLPIVRLTQLAAGSSEDKIITIVNSRDRSEYTRNPYLSDKLLNGISQSLTRKEQSLVFLNRRGTARVVMCQNCDWQALCPNCDLPLTYHGDSHTMRCHTCGNKQPGITACPVCHSTDILYKSVGTKALETSLHSLFPQARIQRFDTDNIKEEKFEQQYKAVKKGTVDILVGTQMLVKGLDLPKLSFVGVVAADSSLSFPDYTADEQTYQLLSQVIGRVGRGHRKGSVVIQTHNPSGQALVSVLSNNWDQFYKQQLEERKQFMFPPYCYILKLTCTRKSQKSAVEACTKLRDIILSLGIKIEVVGPSPRFIELVGGQYSWQIIVKSKLRSNLLSIITNLPANWNYDLDPINLL